VGESRGKGSLVHATDRRANCAAVYSIGDARDAARCWTEAEDAGCRMAGRFLNAGYWMRANSRTSSAPAVVPFVG